MLTSKSSLSYVLCCNLVNFSRAHNAITISSEDPSEDTDDNVRAAIGEDSNILHYYLSNGTGI